MATVSSSKRQLVHTSNTYQSNSDLTVGGDLFVNGATTTIDTTNLLVEDHNIVLGNVSTPTDTTAHGGGITLKGASDYTINWHNSGYWEFNQGITVGENGTGHDVVFYGDTSDRYLTWDQSADRLNLRDHVELTLGTHNDLKLFHDNVRGRIVYTGANELQISGGSTVAIGFNDGTGAYGETGMTLTKDGAVKIRHNNSQKFTTTSGGVDITGALGVSTNLNVGGYGTFNGLDINGNSQFDGAVTVGVNDTGHDVKFFGATSGRYLLWDESANALTGVYDLKVADNREIQLGGSNDLRLYHSHPHSYIVQGNSGGSLYIRSHNTIQLESSDGEDMITCAANGAVTLHYDAASHLQTTSTGVNVTGKMTSDTITTAGNLELFESGNNNYISSVDSGKHLLIRNTGGANVELLVATSEKGLIAIPNGAVQLYHNNALKLTTTAGGADVSGTFGTGSINLDGELNFTTNGSKYIDANTLANSNTFNIRHHNPSGNAFQTAFQSAANGATTLYHSGNAKFATTTDGIRLYGNGYIDLPDNGRARFGDSYELAIYHNGANNGFIHNTTPYLVLESDNIILRNTASNEDYAKFLGNGAVELYYNNSKKLETTNDGIKVAQGSGTNGHLIGRKDYSVTQTFSTGLTVTLADHQACHVKVFISGDWSSHSSIAYVGEFFIQNTGNVGTYNEPGIILTEHDNLPTDGILSKIVDGTSDSFEIQFRANTNSATSVSGRLCYHVMGDASAVS